MTKMANGAKVLSRTTSMKAQGVRHGLKDRILERRLDRAQQEADRLEHENSMLRDQLEESHQEHERIIDLIDDRLSRPKGKGGRFFLMLLLAIGGFVWMRMRDPEMIDRLKGRAKEMTGGMRSEMGSQLA
jgi:hypothetical protein